MKNLILTAAIGIDPVQSELFIKSLKKSGYKNVVSVEMLKSKNNNLTKVNKILNLLN